MDCGKSQGRVRHDFGQPAEVFEKFPDRDVFIAGKDGARWEEPAHQNVDGTRGASVSWSPVADLA
jgi:hypothetical protein